jgi:hypothetical protein
MGNGAGGSMWLRAQSLARARFSLEDELDSYVIHIYRREPGDPKGIIGTVEVAGEGKAYTFRNLQEVCDILTATPRKRGRTRGGGKPPTETG